jgi:diazepam-binding inhibitor (GABA receptor modulating acyl-CoA-binding protein)
MDDKYPLAKHFDTVKDAIKQIGDKLNPTPSNDDLLDFYGLYKQSLEGDNTTSQPYAIYFRDRAKWDAWTKHKGKSSDQAKHEYVELAVRFFPEGEKQKYSS